MLALAPTCKTFVVPMVQRVATFARTVYGGCFGRNVIDIAAKGKYPANILSNFTPSTFKLDGILIKSMEGFLQSLKTPDPVLQKSICLLTGKEAKMAGQACASIFDHVHLNWGGQSIDRFSQAYQNLLKRAYDAKFYSDSVFREALKATAGKKLVHTIGIAEKSKTVLTEHEFISLLDALRTRLF